MKKQMDLQKFKGTCDIYRLRRGNLLKEISEIDEEASEFTTSKKLPQEVNNLLLNHWNSFVIDDVARIDRKWTKKAASTELAHHKEKQAYTKTNPTVTKLPERDHSGAQDIVKHHRKRYRSLDPSETALKSTNTTSETKSTAEPHSKLVNDIDGP